MHKSRYICMSCRHICAFAHRGAIYFCSKVFLSLIIHGYLFFPKVAVKIIDKTQLNPTSLQKVRIYHNIWNSMNSWSVFFYLLDKNIWSLCLAKQTSLCMHDLGRQWYSTVFAIMCMCNLSEGSYFMWFLSKHCFFALPSSSSFTLCWRWHLYLIRYTSSLSTY